MQSQVLGRILAFFLALLCGSAAASAKSEYIDSVVAAINSANGQARVSLVKGRFSAKQGEAKIVFEVPSEMNSKLKFRYENHSWVSASWDFEKSIFIEITVNEKCVRLEVKKLAFGEGGFLTGDSNQDIVGGSSCRESEPIARMDDFLRLSPDPGEFFKGNTVVSSSDLKNCLDQKCTTTGNHLPIRKVTFYGSSEGSALKASFSDGSRIILPQNGFLALAANSGAEFFDLAYDVKESTGEAVLKKFAVELQGGIVSGGDTVLNLAPNSKFTAEDVKFKKNNEAVLISRGGIEGQLGQGSSIKLSNADGKTSVLNIDAAKISLAGLDFNGNQSASTISFTRGSFSTRLVSGEIWFTERNSIQVGFTSLDFTLGCPASDVPPNCKPVTWSPNSVAVHGKITAFSTSIEGGQFNIANVGLVRVQSGKIAADDLVIDTTNPRTPVTGKIRKFEATLRGQELSLDANTSVKVAEASVSAYDIAYVAGQDLPVGKVSLTGSANSITGGNLGRVNFEANANFDFQFERKSNDEPELKSGSLKGASRVRMSEGNFAAVDVILEEIRYYRGHGDATLKLIATEGGYSFSTPSASRVEKKATLKAEIDVKSIRLRPELASPLTIGPTSIKASQSEWEIAPVTGVPFKLSLPIAEQEAVYAPIKDRITEGTICAPKVILKSQSPSITGRIDVFASNSGGKVKVYDNALSAGIEVTADGRNCDAIADLVCFLVGGGAFGGVVGGAALAVLCDSSLDDAKEKLSNTVRDESLRRVSESKFEFAY